MGTYLGSFSCMILCMVVSVCIAKHKASWGLYAVAAAQHFGVLIIEMISHYKKGVAIDLTPLLIFVFFLFVFGILICAMKEYALQHHKKQIVCQHKKETRK